MSTNDTFVEPYPGYADENKGPLIIGVISALTGLTLLFVVGRVWSRFLSIGKLAIDDYIVIGCIVCAHLAGQLPSLSLE